VRTIESEKSGTLRILIEEELERKSVGFEMITRVLDFCFIDLGPELFELGVNKNNPKVIRHIHKFRFYRKYPRVRLH
jgi:RimJ/RimL family protein N-acetyltransferase